jgi:hypothetical protein
MNTTYVFFMGMSQALERSAFRPPVFDARVGSGKSGEDFYHKMFFGDQGKLGSPMLAAFGESLAGLPGLERARPRQDNFLTTWTGARHWRDTLYGMIGPRSYRRVKIELDVKQNEDGNWVGRYQLT